MSGIYQVYTIIINFLRFPDVRLHPGVEPLMHTCHDYSGITQHENFCGMDGSTQGRMITEKLITSA
jgi:hypothetical protein